MHKASMMLMEKHLFRQWISSAVQYPSVLDVGSLDINGSYRELVESHHARYTGLDLIAGQNVDVVSSNPYFYPFSTGSFDVVMCGNMLHMTPYPGRIITEMARLTKVGGLVIAVTVWNWGDLGFPTDFFRMTAEGLRVFFDETDCLRNYYLENDRDGNTAGSAIKYAR